MGKLTIIANRIYSDFLMSSRLSEYENIIKKSLEAGYEHITLRDYIIKLKNNSLEKKKYFIHRHDIDTDLRTTRKIFEIEKKYNVKATYYFRLSTVDYQLMNEINQFCSEASYHFEEIAQYCKDNHIKSRDEVFNCMDDIKSIFIKNIKQIELQAGFKIETVASHGDFVNRKLNIMNNELTNDKDCRMKTHILAESYDYDLQKSFNIYISDKPYPSYYKPENIFNVIGKYDVICMLTHPRHWETNLLVNLIDNIKRFYEGLVW